MGLAVPVPVRPRTSLRIWLDRISSPRAISVRAPILIDLVEAEYMRHPQVQGLLPVFRRARTEKIINYRDGLARVLFCLRGQTRPNETLFAPLCGRKPGKSLEMAFS